MRLKTKIKRKLNKVFSENRKDIIIITAFMIGCGLIGHISQLHAQEVVVDTNVLTIKNHNVKAEEMVVEKPVDKETTMKEWIKMEVEKAGLDWEEAECVIKNESGWNEYAQGVNNNKTTDSGIFQINSIHKNTISLMDRFDYKKATKWAIEKRLHDGNWSAWYGSKKCK